jgi:pimeloyl-ACP methyl ester carboxylesterase
MAAHETGAAAMSAIRRQKVGPFDVNVWSKGTGYPLLFLHGYERHPGGAPFLERLAERHTVHAPEQPGYGTSVGFDHVDDLLDLVLFYRALIESWGVDRIDVVGHSTGGMIAAELAVVAPRLVRRLVLVDAFGLWIDDEPAADPFGPASQVLAAKWHDPAARPDPEPSIFVADPTDPQGAILFEAQNRATATKFMWPIAERGLRRRLRYVDAPTLVVHGASDGLLPMAYAEELAGLIDGAELVRIADAGHYPMIEQEDAFLAAVTDFLAGEPR